MSDVRGGGLAMNDEGDDYMTEPLGRHGDGKVRQTFRI